jgi:hypothetical protein
MSKKNCNFKIECILDAVSILEKDLKKCFRIFLKKEY